MKRALLILALASCSPEAGETQVVLHIAGQAAGQECLRVQAVRLSDLTSSEYVGPTDGAVLVARPGGHRLSAVAYASPCTPVPDPAPWVSEPVEATFKPGVNAVTMELSARVEVTTTFPGDIEAALLVRAGTLVRVGRNGEDASYPRHALDAWEVKLITLPPVGKPGSTKETLLFSTRGALPYPARGMAVLPDGRFVFQLAESWQPLRVFSAAGAFVESWAVTVPAGKIVWDATDGLDAIDATRLVRTGWLDQPRCGPTGCVQAGLDVLHRIGAGVEVGEQILLPARPVGVAHVAGSYAVSMGGAIARFDAAGTMLAGPALAGGDVQGLFDARDGRLMALDYGGRLTSWNSGDLGARPAETKVFPVGLGLERARSLAWDRVASRYLVLSTRLVSVSSSFASPVDTGITLPAAPTAIEVLADRNQVAILEGDTVTFHDLATRAQVGAVTLDAPATSLAYVEATQELVTVDGSPRVRWHPTRSVDLAAVGIVGARSVSDLPASGELLFVVTDGAGVDRLLVTGRDGTPRRSYRLGTLPAPVADTAQTAGGDVGLLLQEPDQLVRIAPP